MLFSSNSKKIDANSTFIDVVFALDRLYLIFNFSEEFHFKDVFTWDLFDIIVYNKKSQPFAILDKKLGYPGFVVLDANGTFEASLGDEMTVSIDVRPIYAQINDSIKSVNFTFDLYGLVTTFDNSTYGAEYNFETSNLDFISNVASGIGSLFVDDNFTFKNNSGLVSAAAAFWACDDCSFREDYGWFTNTKFINNYAENAGAAMTLDCLFINQVTDGYAGNIYAYGSSLTLFNATAGIWLEHSIGSFGFVMFSNNYAYNGHGSCLYISDVTELIIANDEITDDSNVLSIENCSFDSNKALFGGGAIYINTDYEENDLQYPTGNETTLPPSPFPTQSPTHLPSFMPSLEPTEIPTAISNTPSLLYA